MFERVGEDEGRGLSDWMKRGAVALLFVLAGLDKFTPGWVGFFDQVGIGQWFRYFTGVVEIGGAVLVLIPWTVSAGLALLACTMASAALILIFVIHHPADSVVSGALFIALALFWWSRRN
jgi:uncharacterized membrane protein YphA (DoxX/SURF4 family)